MKKFSQLDEGLVSVIKTKFQITKAVEHIYKYFKDNEEKYQKPEDIKMDLRKVAEEAYDKYVTVEDALKFGEWFPDFEKSFLNELKNSNKVSNS